MANGSITWTMANPVTRGFRWPAPVARRTACCTHFQAVTRDTSINLPRPTVPKLVAAVRAVCRSGWTGTTRSLRPLPCRTTRVGRSEPRCRSRASRARASDTRRPARHCSSIVSLALGLGAAAMRALTSGHLKVLQVFSVNYLSQWLGHGRIQTTLGYLGLAPDPSGSLASVP